MSNFVVSGLVENGGRPVQLRARDGRAVLAEDDIEFGIGGGIDEGDGAELDSDGIQLDADLARALQEWARVAEAVARSVHTDGGASAAGGLISRRGRQLATRLAVEMGTVISYVDPLTGEVVDVGEPEDDWPPRRAGGAHAVPSDRERPDRPAQRTPWGTGLVVSAFAAMIVLFAVIALSEALGAASRWLAVAANVIIALGLAPSIWLARNVPVWRWVAYGVIGGIVLAWIALLFTLL
ncbi:MAG TPA: DUF2537 domain-containing protein [Pseudonocardiaceae bacterium]|nr:DUF2537 domain-containing protein [Pseudonocardiaceae bacterium]